MAGPGSGENQGAREIDEITAILGRAPRGASRVAMRDTAGRALVIAAAPIRRSRPGGRLIPDPDFYWLCCPRLRVELARLEATGTIANIESELVDTPNGLARLHADHARYAEARHAAAGQYETAIQERDGAIAILETLADRGIAGSSRWDRVKCLHAQVAFALMHGTETYERDSSETTRHGVVTERLVANYGISLPTRAT